MRTQTLVIWHYKSSRKEKKKKKTTSRQDTYNLRSRRYTHTTHAHSDGKSLTTNTAAQSNSLEYRANPWHFATTFPYKQLLVSSPSACRPHASRTYKMTHFLFFLPPLSLGFLVLRISRTSWKKQASLFNLTLADVSKKAQPHCSASSAPSLYPTCRWSFKSHLFPVNRTIFMEFLSVQVVRAYIFQSCQRFVKKFV